MWRVTCGTSLLQVLDRAHPALILTLRQHRSTKFTVGMHATAGPVDLADELPAVAEYFDSGPLIRHAPTLLVHRDRTLGGVQAVITFADERAYNDPTQRCESAHRAVVIIPTNSGVASQAKMLVTNLTGVAGDLVLLRKVG